MLQIASETKGLVAISEVNYKAMLVRVQEETQPLLLEMYDCFKNYEKRLQKDLGIIM